MKAYRHGVTNPSELAAGLGVLGLLGNNRNQEEIEK